MYVCILKADVSSVSPSSERIEKIVGVSLLLLVRIPSVHLEVICILLGGAY